MTGISSIASASLVPGHLAGASGAKAAQNSGLGSGNSASGSSASGNTTTTISNADGSITTTVVNAQGQIVASSTTQSATPNQAVLASNFATQADTDILHGQMPSALLNMVV